MIDPFASAIRDLSQSRVKLASFRRFALSILTRSSHRKVAVLTRVWED
jgi:hypothetical protein